MKKQIAFYVFLAAIAAADIPTTTTTKTDLLITGAPTSGSINLGSTTLKPMLLTFQMAGSNGTIMTISPLPQDERKDPKDVAELWPRYHRPEKPEEITVILWTKDGKKWVAKWVEAEAIRK